MARIRALLESARAGYGGALLIRGEAGTGKSALLGTALSEVSGFTVLALNGLPLETDVPYSGLERLLLVVRGTTSRAADSAEPVPGSDDAAWMSYVAVARGLKEVLGKLVDAVGPVVLRVDDAHWLDAETRHMVGTLAHRIADLPVAVLVAIRPCVPMPALSTLEELPLAGLTPKDVRELICTLTGHPVAPAVARAVSLASGGNPQAVSDMTSALSREQLAGQAALPDPLPLGERLASAFAERTSVLGDRCRVALVMTALTGGRTPIVQMSLESAELTMADLLPAEDAGVLRRTSDGVEFTNPLVRAALYSAAGPQERRRVHELVAQVRSVLTDLDVPHGPTTALPSAVPATSARVQAASRGRSVVPSKAAALLAGADVTASSYAPAAARGGAEYTVQLLGSFAVHLGSQDVTPRQAQPCQVVKLAALRHSVLVDEVVEALWPEAEPGVGRIRIRNVLSRVREVCPDLLLRDGDVLSLSPATTVDAWDFEHEATASLSGQTSDANARLEQARLAMALYTGELLPADRYATWASSERERLAARHRELLEVVMDESESAGDMLRAIRLAEEAIFLQPYDESLYARAARLMAGLGWRYKALQMLRRAEEVAAELGVPASPSVRQLFVDLRSG